MSLTNDECEKLEGILARAADGGPRLSDWERSFIRDQQSRYEQYGADIWLSPKQWTMLNRIDEAL